jgi:hypothetical protein
MYYSADQYAHGIESLNLGEFFPRSFDVQLYPEYNYPTKEIFLLLSESAPPVTATKYSSRLLIQDGLTDKFDK